MKIISKFLARPATNKTKKTKITNRRNECHPTYFTISKIIGEYYKQLNAYKYENSDEMDKFHERHKTPQFQSKRNTYVNNFLKMNLPFKTFL